MANMPTAMVDGYGSGASLRRFGTRTILCFLGLADLMMLSQLSSADMQKGLFTL